MAYSYSYSLVIIRLECTCMQGALPIEECIGCDLYYIYSPCRFPSGILMVQHFWTLFTIHGIFVAAALCEFLSLSVLRRLCLVFVMILDLFLNIIIIVFLQHQLSADDVKLPVIAITNRSNAFMHVFVPAFLHSPKKKEYTLWYIVVRCFFLLLFYKNIKYASICNAQCDWQSELYLFSV